MAISAFHLDRLSGAECGSGYWWTVAQTYQAKATAHVQISLRHEIFGPRRASYKVLLMALLVLVTACITNGKLTDARKHLLDAQKLIKERGLSKVNPSRKVQMLQTMFLYLRIMEEATFVYPLSSDCALFRNSHSPSSARYPSLAGQEWFSPRGDGESTDFPTLDDFFEKSNPDIQSLFARIYGIPESLVVLMSHITYLACEVRQTKATPHPNPSFADDLGRRCKAVEDLLCDWRSEEGEEEGSSSGSDHAVQAFHGALIMYFYRAVRDINHFTLQHHVRKIKNHILALEGEKIAQNISSASVLYPGFIAAVEAEDPTDFSEACSWMRGCADRYGLRSFDRAADAASDLWHARQQEKEVVPWPEMVLQRQYFMILS
ncbi:Xylulose 5-phosphate/Fructose 6-phosphate phosphoketolase [Neofusicoccum parvum]|uniref:Xylulose 5-phosphate/Fructose 6-phosphate phosphoketolase n=1 Tax=Neofusicoccum parvum TaxID=310453 RepID=A0ACB5SPR4_9PEZI|nr:Xylulose 5-phosphate/Fructose 6-phosphate phosphoketolase [Neofusicoccum parvum]